MKANKITSNLMSKAGPNTGSSGVQYPKAAADNVKVRQALAMAITSRPLLMRVLPRHRHWWRRTCCRRASGAQTASLADYDYDPEKAKALPKEAGFANGVKASTQAMLVQRPVQLNAKTAGGDDSGADWAKIGVQTKIVTYEWAAHLKRVKGGETSGRADGLDDRNGRSATTSSVRFYLHLGKRRLKFGEMVLQAVSMKLLLKQNRSPIATKTRGAV